MADTNKLGPWARSAKLLPAMYAGLGKKWSDDTECGQCGAPMVNSYRAESGAQVCVLCAPIEALEHPAPARVTGYSAVCGQCGVSWYPGHACLRQPTAQEVQDLREQAYWCRVLEDVLDHFGYETSLAAPEAWEAV